MKFQLGVLLLAGICFAAPQNDPVYSIIKKYDFTNEADQADLLDSMRPARIAETIGCLISNNGAACDPRIPKLKEVIQVMDANNYQCATCPLELRFFIVYVQKAMSADKANCVKLQRGLQLKPTFCNQ